jgi:hypothetical protein
MKMKKQMIPYKTDEEMEMEVKEILAGKGHHPHGGKLRQAAKMLRAFKSKEEIEKLFIEEYKKKYKPLMNGTVSLGELKKQVGLNGKDK